MSGQRRIITGGIAQGKSKGKSLKKAIGKMNTVKKKLAVKGLV